MADPASPAQTETVILEEVLPLEPDFYKKKAVYEFSNGRKFEEGLGPYVGS